MKNIIITGGSDGLGKEIAKKLSQNHKVIILSHNLSKLESVSKELNCDYVEADVTDYSSVAHAIDSVLKKYSKIDVLINNAGIWTEGSLEENDPEKIKEIISVNTLGTIFLSRAVIPSMKSNNDGRIINIISQDGLKSKKNRSVYSASKWAITGFTKCLQEDLSGYHVGVTGIYPGLMNTGLFAKQGVTKDLSNSLELSDVASLLEYVINLSTDTLLPEISIKNINNPNLMDDTTAPKPSIDLNPDMMTTPTGIPVAVDPLTPITSKLGGVIDITPGATDNSHPSKVEDITPRDFTDTAKVIEQTVPTAVTPPVTSISEVITATPEPAGIIDITPGAPSTEAPVVESPVSDSGTHLADFVPSTPAPTTITTSVTQTDVPAATGVEESQAASPVITAPPVTETPVVSTTAMTETVIAPTQSEMPMMAPTTTTPTTPSVEVVLPQAAPASPFAEDPDMVKTKQ